MSLVTTAQAILATAVTALGSAAPARQYVAAGLVAYDQCEQLTCSWTVGGMYLADPFPSRTLKPVRCAAVVAADFLLECTRCVPVITSDAAPDPALLTSSAEEIMSDAQTLYCALVDAAPTLFGACRLYSLGPAVPYGPSGAVGGTRISITVQMDCGS